MKTTLLTLVLLALPSFSFAADTASAQACFDHYRFGSVTADLTLPASTVVSGTSVTFSGTVENHNPYPVIDGSLYIKVFRDRTEKDANGPDVVDEFFVQRKINLPANGELPVAFSWQVPSHALSGNYRIATFFTTSKKYNLLGLSFTDDVTGNTTPFKVVGEQEAGVYFDKAGVSVAGKPYHFAAFPPRVSSTSPVTVEATVINDTDEARTVPVHWDLYQWDAGLETNRLSRSDASVTVPAHAAARVSFVAKDIMYPVYLLEGRLADNDAQSVINVRFTREGVDRLRINYPAVTQFPLLAGSSTTLFSCLHNMGETGALNDARLELTLTDPIGRVIHSYTYKGAVTSAMMGVSGDFVPEKNYDRFDLNAKLFYKDALVDETSLSYDCSLIDASLCGTDTIHSPAGALSFLKSLPLFVLVLLCIVLLIIALFIRRYRLKG